jgi:hypothetical protein
LSLGEALSATCIRSNNGGKTFSKDAAGTGCGAAEPFSDGEFNTNGKVSPRQVSKCALIGTVRVARWNIAARARSLCSNGGGSDDDLVALKIEV